MQRERINLTMSRCSVPGCDYIASHYPSMVLCEYHWIKMEQKKEKETKAPSIFLGRLLEIDGGRFSSLIGSLGVSDVCYTCYYLNPKVIDPGQGYLCKCVGSCMAATLSPELKSYLFWKLGEITERQHVANMRGGSFLKITGD